MKVFYWGSFYFTDTDFCVIKNLRAKGIDVRYYIPIEKGKTRGALLDINNQIDKTGIFPASTYPEFEAYKEYIDLSCIYVVNSIHISPFHPANLWLRFRLAIIYILFSPDVFHTSTPMPRTWWFLYYLRGKNVLTLHDPLPHSGQGGGVSEMLRKKAISKSDRIILLSKDKVELFIKTYKVAPKKVFSSHMGYFEYLSGMEYKDVYPNTKYILFYGQIFSYKGLEYLLEAMLKVHERFPDFKLVVAGGGKLYFDISPYLDKDFIVIENHFIEMPKLIGLLRGCQFAVAPYKDATQSGVLLNAFSLNVPMVVTNVGFFPDMVEDGSTGLIVEPCNVIQLAEAMIKLIESPELLAKMRNNIETIWKPKVQWKYTADDFINVYNN